MGKLEALVGCFGPTRRKQAEKIGISASALCQLINHGIKPRKQWEEIKETIKNLALELGKTEAEINEAFAGFEDKEAVEEGADSKEEIVILRKQSLTMQAKKAFGLFKNPFADPETSTEVYMSSDIRYVRECLYQTAIGGGFFALVGESGSGKTTLKDELITRIHAENQPVIIIEPYTLAMAANESQGKPLRSGHITEAIISTVQPGTKLPVSPELRFRKLHEILKASHSAGMRHCLIIEEAHDLHKHTLKSLKRFHELKDGLARLLSIILIGQTELDKKMQVTDSSVREVVQRCDIEAMPAIADPGEYVRHRFSKAGIDCDKCFTKEALEELKTNLTISPDKRGEGIYMGYPLMIANLTTAALNLAASVGEKVVTAEVVKMVR